MEIKLTPDLEAKLGRLAAEQGRDRESVVVEAVERLVSYDEWFARQVDQGVAAADQDKFVDHEEVRRIIDRRYPG